MLAILVVCWVLYYCVHSLLAAPSLKAAVFGRWPAAVRFYRLAYNQLSVWLFLAVLHYQGLLPAAPLWKGTVGLSVAGGGLLVAGLVLAVLALRGYDLGEFAGWRYVRHGSGAGAGPLRTTGLNAVVRHPLYLGILVGLTGWVLLHPTLPWLVFGSCAAAYVVVGVQLEERKLVSQFGEAYQEYRRRVPQLFPL
ncbi:isoprenylcysteine carboxylmethyltransferase family protein [Hymenobacter sp.]|jgi:protein-S-isoprenylcysteine O-methyltransferase Ste14|uniref:methyltransferase family protein n=1 Tax=Hymenobacter sp. TaxID=1898978 RepID=UPI002EDAA861